MNHRGFWDFIAANLFCERTGPLQACAVREHCWFPAAEHQCTPLAIISTPNKCPAARPGQSLSFIHAPRQPQPVANLRTGSGWI